MWGAGLGLGDPSALAPEHQRPSTDGPRHLSGGHVLLGGPGGSGPRGKRSSPLVKALGLLGSLRTQASHHPLCSLPPRDPWPPGDSGSALAPPSRGGSADASRGGAGGLLGCALGTVASRRPEPCVEGRVPELHRLPLAPGGSGPQTGGRGGRPLGARSQPFTLSPSWAGKRRHPWTVGPKPIALCPCAFCPLARPALPLLDSSTEPAPPRGAQAPPEASPSSSRWPHGAAEIPLCPQASVTPPHHLPPAPPPPALPPRVSPPPHLRPHSRLGAASARILRALFCPQRPPPCPPGSGPI